MGCCESTNPDLIGLAEELRNLSIDRRSALKGLAGIAGVIAVSTGGPRPAGAQATKIRLAFCGQLLCVVPYEVTRAQGHFADEGLDVELVYTRGGSAAVQALVGGAVEYAGSSFDVVLQAFKNGADIRRFASTGRLPLFALAVAPERKDEVKSVADLSGRTVGVSALGNADHALMLFLLSEAGVDPRSVDFATLGTNLFDALRLGQVDAAMVQEPALTLIVEHGGTELVNFMELEQAEAQLGGAYEFMGVAVRAEERDQRRDEMRRLAAALAKGLEDTRVNLTPDEIVASLPSALIAGGNVDQLKAIIGRYRASLYPETVEIDMSAAERVMKANEAAGILEPGQVDLETLMDRSVLGG
jgi:NitT/TauT family transport system substrate-binding protein